MILPSASTTTRSAARRAKPISCVTSNSVRPSRFRSTSTSSTSHFQLRVEGAGDLVAQQAARLHRQGAGDGHALLLAAGQLVRIGVGVAGQADARQQLPAALLRLRPAAPQHLRRRLDDVAQGRQVRKELEVLEDHAQQAPHLRTAAADRPARLRAVSSVRPDAGSRRRRRSSAR